MRKDGGTLRRQTARMLPSLDNLLTRRQRTANGYRDHCPQRMPLSEVRRDKAPAAGTGAVELCAAESAVVSTPLPTGGTAFQHVEDFYYEALLRFGEPLNTLSMPLDLRRPA